MGSCLARSSNSNADGKNEKSNGSDKTTDSSDALIDNRPVLRQQPRRRSVEGQLAPVPQRDGPVDPRKQAVTATQSQVDFFRILDEKIEQGAEDEGSHDGENGAGGENASQRSAPSSQNELSSAQEGGLSATPPVSTAHSGVALTENTLSQP